MSAILDGIVVADFSRVLAGPLATATLADLGATVVKVERPGTGDDTRDWGPPWTTTTSAYFESVNRSKLSIELDFEDPSDLAVAQDLARSADVLVENFRAGALDGRGLDHRSVAADNPGLVYCSITGFGSGRGADLAGYDFLVQAVGGLMSITGDEGSPTKVGVALVDVLTAKDATIGILAALHERGTSGAGQRIEVNLLSSLLGSLVNQASSYLATGSAPRPLGNRHPSIAPYETFLCADGQIVVCCGNDRQFLRLVCALGEPDLAVDPRFLRNEGRVANREDLRRLLEERLRAATCAHWIGVLTTARVPAGRVNDIGAALDLARELGLDPIQSVGPGHLPQVRHPVSYSRTPVTSYGPPPRLGEHNDHVRERLATRDRKS